MQTLEQAEQLLHQGGFKQVVSLLTPVIEGGTDNYLPYLYRGVALLQMGRHQDAINDFTGCLELNNGAASAYANRGSAYDQMGRPDLAIQDHNSAIRIQPGECQHYYNRGLAYDNKGDFNQAVEDFSRALELEPSYREALQWRANCLRKLGRNEEAAADERLAGGACDQNFSSAAPPGLGCLVQLMLMFGGPFLLGTMGLGSWVWVLGLILGVLLVDAVVCRVQKPSAWRISILTTRAVLFVPCGAGCYALGGWLATLASANLVAGIGLAVFFALGLAFTQMQK